jgi:AraC family transcriptional regulator
MMSTETSQLNFKAKDSGKREEVLSHARLFATSKTFAWNGIYAEVGENDGWTVDNLVPAGHYIAISRAASDFHFKALQGNQWRDVMIPSNALWIQPSGEPFSFRVETTAQWCGVIIEPARLRSLLGDIASEPAVEPVIGLSDPVLTALMQAVCAEVLRGGTSGTQFADAMIVAIGTQLTRLFGETRKQHKGGLTGRMLRILSDEIETKLSDDISVARLAEKIGLSEAHFARAFKQATGQSPHQFVLTRRLERARRRLADTEDGLSIIAAECGFSDQAHLARQFRSSFGISPSDFRRSFIK